MTDTTHDAHRAETDPAISAPDWPWMLAFGLLMVVGGVLALLNPFAASLTAEALAAAAFLIGGAVQIWVAIRSPGGTGGRIASAVLGVLLMVFGASLVLDPLAGLISLTLIVISLLAAMGIVRIWLGLKARGETGWGWMVAAGLVSLLLALWIFFSLPLSALSILGIFLAVELLSSGGAAIAAALLRRKRANEINGTT